MLLHVTGGMPPNGTTTTPHRQKMVIKSKIIYQGVFQYLIVVGKGVTSAARTTTVSDPIIRALAMPFSTLEFDEKFNRIVQLLLCYQHVMIYSHIDRHSSLEKRMVVKTNTISGD